MRYRRSYLVLGLFAAFAASPRPAMAIPVDDLLNSLQATGDVNDFAGLLSPSERTTLEGRCRQLRERTGAELAVVTLKSLRGGVIDDFANKLFARWGIGQKDQKNGVLLVVAMEEHMSRIEVGYGLEPIIPDVLAARILDQKLRPKFRQQQYAAGLSDTVNAICELIERGQPADRAALEAEDRSDTIPALLFLTLFVVFGSLIVGIGMGSRAAAMILFGLVFAGLPMAMSLALAWPWAPLLQVPLSLLSVVAGRYLAMHSTPLGPGGSSSHWPPGSNWTWGDFSNSSGGGFSQDWGGFGGGSSGGGGASSNW